MALKYFLNTRTSVWHIKGYCPQSKYLPYHIEWFDNEADIYKCAGQRAMPCKICQKKKEEKLRKGD